VVTEILALVNSPLFALPGTVASAGHALSLLGLERTRSVVSTLAMRAMMAGAPKTPVVRRFWTHSVATATIAQHFAETFGVSKDLAYVAGIMHDLGRMGLLSAHNDAYTQLALGSQESAAAILAAEKSALGMDHCEAGLLLAESWALPAQLHAAVANHHAAPLKDRSLESVVQAACRLADALRFQAILHLDAGSPEATIESTVPEGLQETIAGQLEAIQNNVLDTIQALDY
jgi:putative nucleotidyltransferase with HDIG domain